MKKAIVLWSFLLILSVQGILAQKSTESPKKETPQARLIDRFGNQLNSDDRSARIDALIFEIQNTPTSNGVIIFYCGKVCHYGEYETHIRGINQKLNVIGYEKDEITILFGGYKKEAQIEMWLVPKDAGLPIPRSDVKFKDVKFKKKYKKIEWYDCCGLDVPK